MTLINADFKPEEQEEEIEPYAAVMIRMQDGKPVIGEDFYPPLNEEGDNPECHIILLQMLRLFESAREEREKDLAHKDVKSIVGGMGFDPKKFN